MIFLGKKKPSLEKKTIFLTIVVNNKPSLGA